MHRALLWLELKVALEECPAAHQEVVRVREAVAVGVMGAMVVADAVAVEGDVVLDISKMLYM